MRYFMIFFIGKQNNESVTGCVAMKINNGYVNRKKFEKLMLERDRVKYITITGINEITESDFNDYAA